MPSFILDKVVPFDSPINKLNSLTLDDHLTYVLLHEGVRVQGKIAIVGECSFEERHHPFCEELEVDIFLPNSAISDLRNLQVRISDYTYTIGDGNVIFHITCIVEGEELDEEKFMFEKEMNESFKYISEPPKDLCFADEREKLTEAELATLESLIQEREVEIISTCDNPPLEEVIEIEEVFDHEEIDDALRPLEEDKLEEVLPRDNPEEEIIPEAEQENQDEIAIEEECLVAHNEDVFKIDFEKVIPSPFQKVTSQKSDLRLGVKETFAVSFSFYRVGKDDDYLSIAQKYQIDAKKLIDYNKNKELTVGLLIEIPHENSR